MGDALHPVALERIQAAARELHDIAIAELPEAMNNGVGSPSEFVEIGERARAAGEAIVRAANLPQVRVEGPDDEDTCMTCRAALGRHHVIDGGRFLREYHRCEKLEQPGEKKCRCVVVEA